MAIWLEKAQQSIYDRDWLVAIEGAKEYQGMLYSANPELGVFSNKEEIDRYFASWHPILEAMARSRREQ